MQRYLLLCAFLLSILSGCGGGTTGSGDGSSLRVLGTVTSQTGAPLAQASITDVVSGASTETDAAGNFSLPAERKDNAVVLDVTAQGTSGTITVPNVPQQSSTISIEVVVDSTSGIVSLASVEIDASSLTTPTAEVSQAIKGFILSRSHEPISGALVTIAGASARQSTDDTGRFVMTGHSRSGTMTLQVRYKGERGTVKIKGIPTDRAVGITVRLTLSIDAGQDPGDGSGGGSNLSITLNDVSIH